MLERLIFVMIGFVAGCVLTYAVLWIWSANILYLNYLDKEESDEL